MSDDLSELLTRLQSLTPEERARLLSLAAGDAAAGDKVGGDKVVGDKVVEQQGTVNVSDDARINGVAVGINLGTIIYGRPPIEDERRRLVWYLARLASKLYRLPLRGLEERLDQGEGLALPRVYVELAMLGEVVVASGHPNQLHKYLDLDRLRGVPASEIKNTNELLRREYHLDWALPSVALIGGQVDYAIRPYERREDITVTLIRRLLATEALNRHQRLVLLGDPGGGKSTFVRHLAWALARRGLDQLRDATALFGWDDQQHLLPIILPLRALAGRLARDGFGDTTVYAALRDEILSCNITQVDDMLSAALHRGAALLLFDGLDEVPLDGLPGVTVDRATTLGAVRAFTQLHAQARALVTCRTRAFDNDLRKLLGWREETLAPFTLGQIRHFVPAWYAELVDKAQIEPAQATQLGQELIDAITDPLRPQLRAMAENPLLLTMMALVLYNKGVLPRDRPQLYERILELLLGQWDKVRDGQSLAEHLDLPGLTSERLRPLLDQLSYDAHAGAASEDGRGRLARGAVRDALIAFFEREHPRRAWDLAQRALDYIEQRSGLLTPDGPDSYVFAHLTLQEHCAGRHMLLSRDATALVMHHRAEIRWREAILLGLGVVQQTNPWLIESVLRQLIDHEEDGRPKQTERWQRDLILAAEIGRDRDWAYLRDLRVDVEPLRRDLRRGLVELLNDKTQPLPIVDRVRAGFLLGELGDPRFPVTIDDWRRELAKAQAGDTSGYFCRVEAGTYTIGSPDDDPDANDAEKPQHTVTFDTPFLIARYLITNAQWRAWVDQAGGQPSYTADEADLNSSNQPVVAQSWYSFNHFCTWLSEHLCVTVRMPTEQEWEAAARGDDARRYPWGNEWQDDRAATAEDQEARGARNIVPVGCYPSGAAPCGALDMAGNVQEWTLSAWQSYPGAQKPFAGGDFSVLRGGSWDDNRKRVRCGARNADLPGYYFNGGGFRVVVAPRLAQMF